MMWNKCLKIIGGLLSQLLKREHSLQYRHMLGNVTDQRRGYIAGEGTGAVRRSGFNQQAIQRRSAPSRSCSALRRVSALPENEI